MNVDEAGHHHQVAPVERLVDGAGEARADVEDAILSKSDVEGAPIDMLARGGIPNDAPVGTFDQRRRAHRISSMGRLPVSSQPLGRAGPVQACPGNAPVSRSTTDATGSPPRSDESKMVVLRPLVVSGGLYDIAETHTAHCGVGLLDEAGDDRAARLVRQSTPAARSCGAASLNPAI